MSQWQGRLHANLLTTVHLVDSGLIDGCLRGSSVGSTNDLGLSKYIVLSMRQPHVDVRLPTSCVRCVNVWLYSYSIIMTLHVHVKACIMAEYI